MRFGRSVFLGLVEAELADYGDCSRFQITCPACHEAVFKRVRTSPRETHFFSHYREVPDEQAQRCELRVSSITPEQVEKAKAEARGQALAVFVARFRGCVLRAGEVEGGEPIAKRVPEIAEHVPRMIARPTWRALLRRLRAAAVDVETVWEAAQRRFAEKNSALWRREQVVHARAMLDHALSPGGDGALLYLGSFSAIMAGLMGENEATHGLEAMNDSTELHLRRLAGSLAAMPDSDPAPIGACPNLLERIMRSIPTEMALTLMMIPYGKILRETIGRTERPRRTAL